MLIGQHSTTEHGDSITRCSLIDRCVDGGPAGEPSVECQGRRELPLSVDLRCQIGDLLLRSGNGVSAGDEAARRWFLARNGDERSRKLGRIPGLQAILSFPKLELLRSALGVVLDGWLGVVRRLLREESRAEELSILA